MVMQWRHLEYPSSFAILSFGVFEIARLDNHRERFGHEYTTRDNQHERLMNQHRDDAKRTAQRQRTSVAHEYLCRMAIEPEKAQAGADHRRTNDRQFASSGNIGHLQIRGGPEIAGKIGQH